MSKVVKIKHTQQFCPNNVSDPFETILWEKRTATIKGDNGETLFEQKDCEFPRNWSQLATNIVASKYFYGEHGTDEREYSIRQLVHRVVKTITDWGIKDGYFESNADAKAFYNDLCYLCVHQYVAFNSPVWFNVGLYSQYKVTGDPCNWHWSSKEGKVVQPENSYKYPQASACFIQSVEDNMESIMELATSEAMLFKFGSGTGTDLSTIRSDCEKLSGGGKPSGPLSFMRIYDQIAAVVKSGGKTRRAAKMQSIKVDHPDVMDFIDCKYKEELKGKALVQSGYSTSDSYSSLLYQNANLSVRLSDEFMDAVKKDKEWSTRWVTDPNVVADTYRARDIFHKIALTAWGCGDPGVQFDTIINKWHTCPNSGRINASNPCSEYMFIDDSACNLASVNLMKFREEHGHFDYVRFSKACRIIFIAQDILVDNASYPTKKITENSHKFRPIGLGYTNLGALIMSNGLPYDSDEARGLCSAITSLQLKASYMASNEIAMAVGAFPEWANNQEPMIKVIERHAREVNKMKNCPKYLRSAVLDGWDYLIDNAKKFGFRNAQVTVLAPTGTISFMMDCDTTGIEPEIAMVKFKQLAGGGTLKMINRTVPLALAKLGYSDSETEEIVNYIIENRTIDGAPYVKEEHLDVFDCAFASGPNKRSIQWKAHINMMAAAQPFISGAISKTVNMPNDVTVEDIESAYMYAWEVGIKSLAIYRDGSKNAQPLNLTDKKDENKEIDSSKLSHKDRMKLQNKVRREKLPDTRQAITHKFDVAGHEGYITVGLYPDGRVGEVFITMAKEGSTIGGLMDCFSTVLSLSLQYGVPLKDCVRKFMYTQFEPMGFTKNKDIPRAKSLIDYVFRWLQHEFLKKEEEQSNAVQVTSNPSETMSSIHREFQSDAPVCDSCGSITVRSGNCYLCYNCGKSMGCS